jgi:diguanylate cyclase (GGDEF)-like protein
MCDMDGFKDVNSIYGHDGGDAALKIVAKIITSNVRLNDYAIRFGGDEFLICFTNCSKEAVYNSMERIRKQVEQNGIYNITLSIGIAYNENDESVELLKTKADQALYCSKDFGKNQITIYSDILKRETNTSICKAKTLATKMS